KPEGKTQTRSKTPGSIAGSVARLLSMVLGRSAFLKHCTGCLFRLCSVRLRPRSDEQALSGPVNSEERHHERQPSPYFCHCRLYSTRRARRVLWAEPSRVHSVGASERRAVPAGRRACPARGVRAGSPDRELPEPYRVP